MANVDASVSVAFLFIDTVVLFFLFLVINPVNPKDMAAIKMT